MEIRRPHPTMLMSEYEMFRPRGLADQTLRIEFSMRYMRPTASSSDTFLSSNAAALRNSA